MTAMAVAELVAMAAAMAAAGTAATADVMAQASVQAADAAIRMRTRAVDAVPAAIPTICLADAMPAAWRTATADAIKAPLALVFRASKRLGEIKKIRMVPSKKMLRESLFGGKIISA